MQDESDYKRNPLHGVSLKTLLTEMVDYYGFNILYAYLNINCFKTNPGIDSSVKFLKNTQWAREKVESFYLYEFKNLPRATDEQYELSPRDRIVPEGQVPAAPAQLSLEDAERLNQKRARKAAEREQSPGFRPKAGKSFAAPRGERKPARREPEAERKHERESTDSRTASGESGSDPWGKWRK